MSLGYLDAPLSLGGRTGGLVAPAPRLPVVLAEAVLLLEARRAPTDGSTVPNDGTGAGLDLEPAAVRGCRIRDDDPAVLAAHTWTDVTTAFTTPHSASLVPGSDGVFIGAQWRAVGDAEAGGTEDGNEVVGKIRSLDTGVSGYDQIDFGLWVGLASPFTVGAVTAIWTDTDDVQQSVAFDDAGLLVDPYDLNALGVWIRPDNGNSEHEVSLYEWVDGAWSLLATKTAAGTSSIRDEEGPLTAMSFSVLGGWAEVRDGGPTGDLMARFDPAADASAPLGPGDTFEAATGETWTLGADCAVFDHPGTPALLCGGTTVMQVPDDDQLDPGTADRTIAAALTAASIITADGGDAPVAQMASGVPGQGGVGWNLTDLRVDAFGLDGFGFIASDGANTAVAISSTGWTAGECHVVVGAFDRDGNLVTYVDGTARGSGDMSSVGSIAPTAALVFGRAGDGPFLLHAWAEWDRLLDADEIAAVTAAL